MNLKVRSKFEQETLPYLDDLWQTALWLAATERDAERLVEDSYIEASRLWDASVSGEGCRIMLFKVLLRIFLQDSKLGLMLPIPPVSADDYRPIPSEKISIIRKIPGEVISDMIRSLPVGNRMVFVLSIFERFSYREIAEIIGISAKSVGQKIYQAYTLIHRELNDYFAYDKADISLARCS
jgi:RNA polymerase sigma factor (sigma-70 family)